jgi:cardiolipin synthase A/B
MVARLPKKLVWIALFGVLLVFALIGWLSITRGTPVRRVIAIDRSGAPPAVAESTFAHAMELMSGSSLEAGNRVEILANGNGTYPVVWDAISSAKRTLTVQWYYSQPGAVADTFAARVAERARAGVKVLVLMDAFGSQNLTKEWARTLRSSGVRLAWLRPVHWYTLGKANFRSHARVLVVDGVRAFTGGYGLADYWLGDGRHDEQWRDMNVEVEGPAAMQLQAAFAAAWAEATGDLLTGDQFFPRAATRPAGNEIAGVLYASPTTGSTNAERFMALSLASARRRIWVVNSYFVPDDDFRGMLADAARRGVDVRILTAGPKTDVKTTTWAGRARYEELLSAGVRIWEYQPTMIHSKTFVIDGLWSTIGSMNFDNRSLAFNNETNVMVLDSAFAVRMEQSFAEDLTYSKEITLAAHRQRGAKARVLEWGANLLSRML